MSEVDLFSTPKLLNKIFSYCSIKNLENSAVSVCKFWGRLCTKILKTNKKLIQLVKDIYQAAHKHNSEDRNLITELLFRLVMYPPISDALWMAGNESVLLIGNLFKFTLALSHQTKETLDVAMECALEFNQDFGSQDLKDLEKRRRQLRKSKSALATTWGGLRYDFSKTRMEFHTSYLDHLKSYFNNNVKLDPRILDDLEEEFVQSTIEPFAITRHLSNIASRLIEKKEAFIELVQDFVHNWPPLLLKSLPCFVEDYVFSHRDIKNGSKEQVMKIFKIVQDKIKNLDKCHLSVVLECYCKMLMQATKIYYKADQDPLIWMESIVATVQKTECHDHLNMEYYLPRRDAQAKLLKARENYIQSCVNNNPNLLFAAQTDFTATCIGIIEQFWERVILPYMGEPPCKLALIAVGSVGRGDMCPYSDLEFIILTEKVYTADPALYCYLETFLWLFDFFMKSLGEDKSSGGTDGFSIDAKFSAVSIDSKLSASIDAVGSDFILPPSKVIEVYFKQPWYMGDVKTWFMEIRNFGIYNSRIICGSKDRQDLFTEFHRDLSQWLDSPVTICDNCRDHISPCKTQRDRCFQYIYSQFEIPVDVFLTWRDVITLGHWWCPSVGTEISDLRYDSTISIKDILRPIITLALTLGCYYGITESHPIRLFQKLRETHNQRVPYAFLILMEYAYFILTKLRIRSQDFAKKQTDTVMLSLPRRISTSPIRGGMSFQMYLELKEEEWQNVLAINNDLISKIRLLFQNMKKNFRKSKEKGRINKKILLPELLAQYSDNQVVFLKNNPPEHVIDDSIYGVLRDFPNTCGFYPFLEKSRKQFLDSLKLLFAESQPKFPIFITSITHGEQYLHPKLVQQLSMPQQVMVEKEEKTGEFIPKEMVVINKKGEFNRDWRRVLNATHIVIPVDFNGISVHFKVTPDCPGMGEAVDILGNHLVGRGSAFTELWYWRSNETSEAYTILVSETVKGDRLSDALYKNPNLAINPLNFSQQVIFAMVAQWEDCQPNNIMYDEDTQEIILIDTERAFVEAFDDEKKDPTLLVKTPLYCFNAMEDPVHPLMCEKLLMLNVMSVLEHWMNKLCDKCTKYQVVFPENSASFVLVEIAKQTIDQIQGKKKSTILPFLGPTVIDDIFNKVSLLQDRLLKHPLMTHMELLSKLDCRLANYYYDAFKRYPRTPPYDRPMYRYAHLTKECTIVAPNGRAFATTMSYREYTRHVTNSLNRSTSQEPTDKELYRKWPVLLRDYEEKLATLRKCVAYQSIDNLFESPPGQEVELFVRLPSFLQLQLVNTIEYKSKDIKYHKKVIQLIKDSKVLLSRLSLSHCIGLQPSDYKFIFHSHLTELNISGMPVEKPFLDIIRQLPQLKKLRIRDCQSKGIQVVQYLGPTIVFPSLSYLDLSNSPKLEALELTASKMEYLNLAGCTELKEMFLSAANLSFIKLDNCLSLKSTRFWYKGSTPRLREFSCKNCNDLVAELSKYKIVEVTSPEQIKKHIDKKQAIILSPNMEVLRLENYTLTKQKIRRLTAAMHDRLKRVYLSRNQCNEIALYSLWQSFPPTLTTISIESNHIGEYGLIDNILRKQINLQYLSLAHNKLPPASGNLLSKVSSRNLRIIKLCDNNVLDRGVRLLCSSLMSHGTLQILHLCKNQISPEGALSISQLLDVNTVLQELSLNDNSLHDDGIKTIARALNKNISLTKLSLQENKITDKGALHLYEEYDRRERAFRATQNLSSSSGPNGRPKQKLFSVVLSCNPDLDTDKIIRSKIENIPHDWVLGDTKIDCSSHSIDQLLNEPRRIAEDSEMYDDHSVNRRYILPSLREVQSVPILIERKYNSVPERSTLSPRDIYCSNSARERVTSPKRKLDRHSNSVAEKLTIPERDSEGKDLKRISSTGKDLRIIPFPITNVPSTGKTSSNETEDSEFELVNDTDTSEPIIPPKETNPNEKNI